VYKNQGTRSKWLGTLTSQTQSLATAHKTLAQVVPEAFGGRAGLGDEVEGEQDIFNETVNSHRQPANNIARNSG
jgi:hypothetical protein